MTQLPGIFRPSSAAFTLIEILVVIAIILVLIGILIPGISIAQRQAREQTAVTVVRQLGQAMDVYRLEDRDRRYPTPNADLSLSRDLLAPPAAPVSERGPLGLIERHGGYSASEQPRDAFGRLLDPWGQTYRYSLTRPIPTAPSPALQDWNWDTVGNRERAWGRRPGDALGAGGPLAFAYLWSLGRERSQDDATHWIYVEDPVP